MITIYNNNNKFKYNYNLKYILNYKFLINQGLTLGSHFKELNIRNSSIIYSIRNNYCILKLQKTIFELRKVLKIIEIISFKRGVIYFINSYISFRIVMNSFFKQYNHYLIIRRKKKLECLYLISKWFSGFLTNSHVYFNTLKFKIKYPRLPHFGFVGDTTINLNSIKEFNKLLIPISSLVDSSSQDSIYSLYSIISNGKSLESIFFYLFNIINSIYIGYYNEKLKFKKKKINLNIINTFSYKKKIFFKNFLFITKSINNI